MSAPANFECSTVMIHRELQSQWPFYVSKRYLQTKWLSDVTTCVVNKSIMEWNSG